MFCGKICKLESLLKKNNSKLATIISSKVCIEVIVICPAPKTLEWHDSV